MNHLNASINNLAVVAVMGAVCLSSAEYTSADPITIDQQQVVVDLSVGGLAIGGNSQQMLAQVVTTGLSGVLKEVRIPVVGNFGNLVVEIQGVTSGAPNGMVLTSQSFPAATLPPITLPTFNSLPFDSPVPLAAGAVFALVLRSTGSFGLFQGPLGNPYPGGDAYFDARPNPPGWIPIGQPRFDIPFQTLVESSAVPEPSTMLLINPLLLWVIRRRRHQRHP